MVDPSWAYSKMYSHRPKISIGSRLRTINHPQSNNPKIKNYPALNWAKLLFVLLVLLAPMLPINATGDAPPKMLGQKMIYDPSDQRIILFGGSYYSNSYTFFGDTWSFDIAKNEWTKLVTNGSPSPRFNHAMVFDSDRRVIVLFGGFSSSDRIGDTWIYDIASNKWINASPQTSPSRRSDPGAAYDAKSKKVIIFGGYGLGGSIKGDTWAFDVESRTWKQMTPSNSPNARYGGIMVYDYYMEKCILFGGHMNLDGKSIGYDNEIWTYDYTLDSWEKLPTMNKPPARYWHDLAYDPEENRIILFGGSQGGGNDQGDTWIFYCKEGKWVKIASAENPVTRSQPSLAYDTSTKRVFMFGGADFVTSGNFIYYNDLWALDENNQWKELSLGTPTGTSQPASGIPGFQPIEVLLGISLAVAALILSKNEELAYDSEKMRALREM